MMSTLGVFVPYFDAANAPLFRDRLPFPWETLPSAGNGPVNARLVVEEGTTYGYGTDTNYAPKAGLEHELKSLNLMFSMQDIVKLMGPNSASYVEMSDELGTLEPGKLGDVVLVDGNPLDGYWNLLNTRLVLKGGVVVSDQR